MAKKMKPKGKKKAKPSYDKVHKKVFGLK